MPEFLFSDCSPSENCVCCKSTKIVINIESDSTTANQKENDKLETVETEESQKQALDEGGVCR